MNREEYMSRLKEALAAFDDEIGEEIISDYEEHFNMGEMAGKTDEEIIAELGSIDELVTELKALSEKQGSTDKPGKDPVDHSEEIAKILGSVGAEICRWSTEIAGKCSDKAKEYGASFMDKSKEYSNTIKDKVKEYSKNINDSETFNSFVDGAGKFAESVGREATKFGNSAARFAKQVAKEFEESMKESRSEDAEWRSTERYDHTDETEEGRCDTVVIDAGCADVEVSPSHDGNINFEYNNNGSANQKMAFRFYHYQEGHTIYAGVERVGTKSSFFSSMNGGDIQLSVEIPRELRYISVKTMSGDIDLSCEKVGTVKLETMSGDIDIKDGEINDLFAHTASGDIDVNDSHLRNMKISTASGDLEAELDEADELETVRVDSASGDCTFSGRVANFAANSASGDIDVTLVGKAVGKVSTASGDVEITLKEADGYSAEVTTVSGTISLDSEDGTREDLRNGNYRFGNAATTLDISTVSGDIEVGLE